MNTKQSFDTETMAVDRLEAMIAAFKAGKLSAPNTDPKKSTPKLNFDDMPEDTLYAHL